MPVAISYFPRVINWTRMHWVKLLLVDAPAFVIQTWLRLYALVLAVGSIIVWSVLLIWLAQAAWIALK